MDPDSSMQSANAHFGFPIGSLFRVKQFPPPRHAFLAYDGALNRPVMYPFAGPDSSRSFRMRLSMRIEGSDHCRTSS